jgi:heme exporter protein CcmB
MFWAVLRKEMMVEWRSKEVLYTSVFFAVLLATIFMFGFQQGSQVVGQVGPGILWIALSFSGTIAFTRTFERERHAGCIAGLRLVPRVHTALFLGKCSANFIMLGLMELVLVPVVGVIFRMPFGAFWAELMLLLVLGTLGLCVLGTVLGAALVNIRLREVLLPLVLFPLIVPLLVAGVSATAALVENDRAAFADWTRLMVAFDVIYTVLSTWLFRAVLEATE